MAAEAEMQSKSVWLYHKAMKDGSVPALGRELVNDVRGTIFEIFFGKGERGAEAGTPLHPLFTDILKGREKHEDALSKMAEAKVAAKTVAGKSVSPADLVANDNSASEEWAKAPEISPADLKDDTPSQTQ